ncbi:MAG: phospholipase [Paramuribaculum sp.]|nr:phospholipase [Paramuribaculum sp.]
MNAALIILAALVAVGLVLWLLDRCHNYTTPDPEPEQTTESTEECCGMHITCEKDSLVSAASAEIEYYDDEELDVYAGLGADDYSEEAIEEFRNVLLTLLPHDIAGWARSCTLRGITLPTPVREELILIVSEARAAKTS